MVLIPLEYGVAWIPMNIVWLCEIVKSQFFY